MLLDFVDVWKEVLKFTENEHILTWDSFFLCQNFTVAEDLSAYHGLELRLKGDGRRYKLIIRTSREWDTLGYTIGFDTVRGEWQSVSLSKTRNYNTCSSYRTT